MQFKRQAQEALVKVKKPTTELRRKGVVYEVPCNDFNHVYIGETDRTLEKRLSEHRSAVKKNDWKNADAVPCMRQRASGEMGASRSEGGRSQSYQQENNGGPAHPATATHHQPGLWANPAWFPLLF